MDCNNKSSHDRLMKEYDDCPWCIIDELRTELEQATADAIVDRERRIALGEEISRLRAELEQMKKEELLTKFKKLLELSTEREKNRVLKQKLNDIRTAVAKVQGFLAAHGLTIE